MAINKKIVRGKEIVNHASNFLLRRCEAAFASLCDLRAVSKPENISSSQAKQSALRFLAIFNRLQNTGAKLFCI